MRCTKKLLCYGWTIACLFLLFSLKTQAQNIAFDKPVITSSYYDDAHQGSNAVDGNVYTKWTTASWAGAPHWLRIDLEATYRITRVRLKHAAAGGEWTDLNTKNYTIETSSDGFNWTARASYINWGKHHITHHDMNVEARYVRLVVHEANFVDGFVRLPEIEVEGTSSNPGNPGGGSCNVVLNASGSSQLGWPFANSHYVNSTSGTNGWLMTCGWNCNRFHVDDDYYALDWARSGGDVNTCGQEFRSPLEGTVIYAAQHSTGYGNTVIVQSTQNGNFAFRVSHLQSISVADGQTVQVGTRLGYVGADGGNFSCHVHAVLYKNIYSRISPGSPRGIDYLAIGHAPSGSVSAGLPANLFAAQYNFNASCNNARIANGILTENLETAENSTEQVNIFPNPALSEVSLHYRLEGESVVKIEVFDLSGKLVHTIQPEGIQARGSHREALSVADWKKGLYLVKLQLGDRLITKKLVIK